MKSLFKKQKSILVICAILIISSISIAGIISLISTKNQINSQKAELATLQQTIKNNNERISKLNKKNASDSAQITALLDQPTPTPIIQYQTKTVTKTQYVDVPGQTEYDSAPPKPVTYIQAGSELMGSNGSTCIMAGSELDCTGGR